MSHTILISLDDNGCVEHMIMDDVNIGLDDCTMTVEEVYESGLIAIERDKRLLARSERAFDRAQNKAADEDARRNA